LHPEIYICHAADGAGIELNESPLSSG
jgi:hypothetical protein